jgi:hypothetical protein
LGNDPAKTVFGSRYWIGGYGPRVVAAVGDALATGEALAADDAPVTGVGVVPADADGNGGGADVCAAHAAISIDASATKQAARLLTL